VSLEDSRDEGTNCVPLIFEGNNISILFDVLTFPDPAQAGVMCTRLPFYDIFLWNQGLNALQVSYVVFVQAKSSSLFASKRHLKTVKAL
jgi:hypothetical protein